MDRMTWKKLAGGLILTSGILAAFAWADEKIEMSTYVPAASNSWDRVHANRATVGSPYSIINPAEPDPPDGTLLVSQRLGIGTAAPTANPSPANGSATGNIDANDVYLRAANRWASQGNAGPEFLPGGEVIVFQTFVVTGWTTVDLSGYVPAGTKAALMTVTLVNNIGSDVEVQARKDAASPAFTIGTLASTASVQEFIQVAVPLDGNRRFQVRVTSRIAGLQVYIHIQGYYA